MADLGGAEILVVEDVRFTRATLAKMLAGLGAGTVHEAEDGEAALARLGELGPRIACVISDLEMPKLDGLGLLRAIRTGAGAIPHDLPVVMLTGHSEFERLGPALLLDLDAFITKPVSKAAIERCMAGLIGGAARHVGPAESYRSIAAAAGLTPGGEAGAAASQAERRVALAELPDGAVLARDLLFSNGRLLLPARTRISQRIARRLTEIAAASSLAGEAWIVD